MLSFKDPFIFVSTNATVSPSVELPILDGRSSVGFISIPEQNSLGEYFCSK